MQHILYRTYLRLMAMYASAGQNAYAFYLSRRRRNLAGADLSYLNVSGSNLSNGNLGVPPGGVGL